MASNRPSIRNSRFTYAKTVVKMGLSFKSEVIEALDSKGILINLKKGCTSALECADVAAFTFAT